MATVEFFINERAMINFHPGYGTILYCDFSHLREPEMVKKRPSIVLSRKNGRVPLCTVIPLSGTEPDPMCDWHYKMTTDKLPEFLRKKGEWWAKCDCITHVSFARLDRIQAGKCPNTGKRLYQSPKAYGIDLKAIKLAVAYHLGISDLISDQK
jgi:uncharacterized protein YifN (PemK superfamily)